MEHFKLVFGSGNSDLAKIRPLKIWTSWISPWVPPYGILPQHAVGQLDIQSQPYEGLNSKCLARIYANKQYTTSGGSGSRKRTHTNTKASKNYATKPPDEESRTNILGSTGT